MYFPFLTLRGWIKRSAAQPQTICSEVPIYGIRFFRKSKAVPTLLGKLGVLFAPGTRYGSIPKSGRIFVKNLSAGRLSVRAKLCYNIINSTFLAGKKMNTENLNLEATVLRKLLSAANADAALLYLYINANNAPDNACEDLHMSRSRFASAGAVLRQLGLWPDEQRFRFAPGQRPAYTETDVMQVMNTEQGFRALYAEVQRLLGKTLNTEELKILLGFTRYLGLPSDVISLLVCYCKERARQQGNLHNPSLRTIEKEAYAWAEQGVDTLEAASAYIQAQNLKNSRISQLMRTLQIYGRKLTAAELRYAESWLDMGFSMGAIALAYERTCLNTGNLSWAYMNKILVRWHESGLHTAEAVRNSGRKDAPTRELDSDEQAAVLRMMEEG